MAMEKKTYVAPESEAVYLRMEMNFTQSQNEGSVIVGQLGARRDDGFDHYDGYNDPYDR
jgi:hypothetical protein